MSPCQRCGNCCRRLGFLTELVGDDEWERIFAFLIDHQMLIHATDYDGERRAFDPAILIEEFREFNGDSLEAFVHPDGSSFSDFIDIVDDPPEGCPFLTSDRKTKESSCLIQEVKPAACAKYFCSKAKEE